MMKSIPCVYNWLMNDANEVRRHTMWLKSGGLCLFQAAKKLRIIGLVSEESIRKEEESRERERNSRKRKAEEDSSNGRAGPVPSTSSAASSSCGGIQVKNLKDGPCGCIAELGRLCNWLFHLLPGSAWVDVKLAEMAEQVCISALLWNITDQSQPNPIIWPDGPPCT